VLQVKFLECVRGGNFNKINALIRTILCQWLPATTPKNRESKFALCCVELIGG